MAWVSNPPRNITRAHSATMPYWTAPIGWELMNAGTSNASSVLLTAIPLMLLVLRRMGGSSLDRPIVSRRHERIGEEVALVETRGRHEIAARLADHPRIAAGIDLSSRQIAEIPQHGVMNEARGPVPFRIQLRQHGDEPEPVRASGPLLRQIGEVQIPPAAAAPIQVQRSFVATLDQVFDDRLDRRETGSGR